MKKFEKTVKALLCIVLAVCVVLCAVGCGGGNDKTTDGKNEVKVDAELKGTTVKMLTWYEIPERESSVSDAFTKKTEIDVKYIVTELKNYQTKLASMVASGASPDLAALFSSAYPSMLVRGLMDPLDTEVFDLENKIYDIGLMDQYKWNNKYYGVAVKGSMMGDMYVVYFNKTMFEERGQQTPYEIWKNNPDDWTWDKFREVAKSMTYTTAAGNVAGFSNSYPHAMMLSTGEDFVKVQNNTITNNMTAEKIKEAWKFGNEMKYTDKSLLSGNSHYVDLVQGKVTMHINGQWFMQKGNSYDTEMTDDWGVAPFPKQNNGEYYAPFSAVLWGNPRNAKNVKGAAAFINYWLDPANEESEIYASEECREVHEWIWEQKKANNISIGILDFKSSGTHSTLCGNLFGGTNVVDTVLAAQAPTIDANIKLVLDETQ